MRLLLSSGIGCIVAYGVFFGGKYLVGVFAWNQVAHERHVHLWMLYTRGAMIVMSSLSIGAMSAVFWYRFLRSRPSLIALRLQDMFSVILVLAIPYLIWVTFYPWKAALLYDRMQVNMHLDGYQISLIQLVSPIDGRSGALEVQITHRDGQRYRQTLDISLTTVCTSLTIYNAKSNIEFVCDRLDFPPPTLSVNRDTKQITIRTPGGQSTRSFAELLNGP